MMASTDDRRVEPARALRPTSVVLLVSKGGPSRRQLANVLRHGRFEVKTARDVSAVSRLLRCRTFAAVVVGDLTGVGIPEFVQDLRVQTQLPILVVSRLAEEWDKVRAIDAGADDYLTDPYGVDELLARLRRSVRRFTRATEVAPIVTDDFTIYVRDRLFVTSSGDEARLTETEWKILEVLLRQPGHLVSRTDLLRAVWGPNAVDRTQYLRVHMVSIRRKVEPDPAHPRYFITVPGLGLRFVPSADAQAATNP